MITLDQDINRIITYLNTGNKKELKNILVSFTPSYIGKIYLRLNPFDQKLWDDLNLNSCKKDCNLQY